jgi:hypothetical protein
VKNCNHQERLFLGCVGNQEIANWKETKRLRGQLLASETHVRKLYQLLKRGLKLREDTISRTEVICGN